MRQDKERSIREQADLWKGYWCILACILLVGRVSYLTFFQNHIVSVYAAAQTEQKEDSSVQILQENLMEEIQIDDVQKMLDEIMDDHVFSVREALMNIINGEEPVSKETVRSFLYSLFFSDIENEKGLILKLLLVIFIAAVLAEFADVFGNGQAGSISFYIVYLALFTMLMENFSRLGSTLTNWLLGLMDFMKVLSPAYFMTVAASTGSSTAAAFYEGILLMIWAVQWLLANLFLPAVNLSLLLKMVNYLSKEEMLTKMAELLETFCCWQGSECDSRHWKCSDRCNRISADQCSDGAKQFWRSNRDPSVADWSRTDYPLWKSFSGLSFSGCDCTANF